MAYKRKRQSETSQSNGNADQSPRTSRPSSGPSQKSARVAKNVDLEAEDGGEVGAKSSSTIEQPLQVRVQTRVKLCLARS